MLSKGWRHQLIKKFNYTQWACKIWKKVEIWIKLLLEEILKLNLSHFHTSSLIIFHTNDITRYLKREWMTRLFYHDCYCEKAWQEAKETEKCPVICRKKSHTPDFTSTERVRKIQIQHKSQSHLFYTETK